MKVFDVHEIGPIRDDLIYREYTLALIWPRSCPDFLTDDEVSDWLNYVARTETLPWQLGSEDDA